MKLEDPVGEVLRGIALCRRDAWDEGLEILGPVADAKTRVELPSTFYSFLGYGLARQCRRYREGLSLCEYAVKVGICEPENYLNTARTLLLMNRRGRALGILNRGLALSPQHADLVETRLSLGVRRSPVLPFLGRSNLVNRALGRLRHRLRAA